MGWCMSGQMTRVLGMPALDALQRVACAEPKPDSPQYCLQTCELCGINRRMTPALLPLQPTHPADHAAMGRMPQHQPAMFAATAAVVALRPGSVDTFHQTDAASRRALAAAVQ